MNPKTHIFLCCLFLAACATTEAFHPPEQVGMVRRDVAASPFTLTTYARITDPAAPVRIYIEGDGFAWVNRYEMSRDPTPRKALGLMLAERDTAPNVVYLARPCQFRNLAAEVCSRDYWAGKRFSEEVISAMNEAVDTYASQGNRRVELVGYSGGAAVAALVAVRRKDVAWLISVAGNLDHQAVNQYHKVTKMPDSLNPADFKVQLQAIPQTHFSGEKDNIIPPWVSADFSQSQRCVRHVVVGGASHEQGWVERWPKLLEAAPACHN